ncbi:MAG: helix-turn-helix domain-containing protein [Bacilli bacterium]|nr:helix-turn-helix domain-containing protein [Bacilli bacterium]
MKEIGEKLKEARESIGVSIEEVAEDLKIRASQIENIEAGNSDAFKDVFNLKYLIRDYAKYLGLNKEDLVDEFNEYLFDYTSRLSLDDIKLAKKERKQAKRIKSPYTIEKNNTLSTVLFVLWAVILVLVLVIVYLLININSVDDKDFVEGAVVSERE